MSSAARDKVSREDAQPEVHSPCSHHQKISTAVPAIGQPKQNNGAPRTDHKGTTIVVCSASSDSGSPLPSHYLKPESEDATGSSGTGGGSGSVVSSGASANGSVANCRTEEQSDVPAPSNGNGSNSTTTAATSTGNRCIAGVFAGHGELKSVLGTVVKFATGISPDTGDTVLTLVLALLVNPSHVFFSSLLWFPIVHANLANLASAIRGCACFLPVGRSMQDRE